MLEAYCDESGIHDDALKCVVAGWVAAAPEWQLFEDKWARASDSIDFHAKEFFGRDDSGRRLGPYASWTDDRALRYMNGLIEALSLPVLRPTGAVVHVDAFRALTLDERRWLTGGAKRRGAHKWHNQGSPNRPYYLGFMDCLEGATNYVQHPHTKVNFFFDQQSVLAPHALRFYQLARAHLRDPMTPKMGDIAFKGKAGIGALQAADLLAHVLYRMEATGARRQPEFVAAGRAVNVAIQRDKIVDYTERALRRRLELVLETVES